MTALVIIRPEPGASSTFARARALDLNALRIPLFELSPLEWQAPENTDAFDGIVATSANAFRFGGSGLAALRSLPVHAVGTATASAARDAGFEVASVGDGGASELGATLPCGRYLRLAGRDHVDLAGMTTLAVYQSRAIDPPPALPGDAVALVHSPRAGARLAEIVDKRSQMSVAAISEVAANAAGAGWKTVMAAGQPTDEALLALALGMCQDIHR